MTRRGSTGRSMARALLAAAFLSAGAGAASAQQILNLSIGGFTPHGEDARTAGDVLNENRTFLTFDVKDFNAATVGGEWLVPIGDFFEAGAGVGFYRRSVPSVYTNFTNANGSEIEQTLRLRLVPFAATVRMLPFGRHHGVQPYFGAGLGVVSWRYSESGDFIDFATPGRDIFRDTFVASGTATGPVALGGLRFAGDSWVVGGEVRYTKARGGLSSDFAGDKIDLGGWTYQATFGFRFR